MTSELFPGASLNGGSNEGFAPDTTVVANEATGQLPGPLMVDGVPYEFHAFIGTTSSMKHEQRVAAENAMIVYTTLHLTGIGRVLMTENTHRREHDHFYLNPDYTAEDVSRIFRQLEIMYPKNFGNDIRGWFAGVSAGDDVRVAIAAAGIPLPGEQAA